MPTIAAMGASYVPEQFVSAVPAPATLALLFGGLGALAATRKKRRRRG